MDKLCNCGKRLRFRSWWWGKFIKCGGLMDSSIIRCGMLGFEPYDENAHGLQNAGDDE